MSEDTPEAEGDVDADAGAGVDPDAEADGDSTAAAPGSESEPEPGEGSDVADDLAERVGARDESLGAEVAALREERDALAADFRDAEARIEDLTERLQRTQADFQNYKKRSEREQERVRERATEDLVERLVGVRDNLARALEESDAGSEEGDAEGIRGGVETTLAEFDRILEDENVEVVEPDPGEEVDPKRHQVMLRVDSDRPEGVIDEVYRPGYEMAGKVLREAQVTVSDGA
jgi:molecular chaperone GrpE